MESRFIKARDLEIASLDDQSLVLQPESRRFHLLNGSAAFILSRLTEPRTASEIAGDIVAQFSGVDLAVACASVETALDGMLDAQIANIADGYEG
jgi:coenzyme PQQ synthesis protein D (PqqD)